MSDVDEKGAVAGDVVRGLAAADGQAGSVATPRVPAEWWQRWAERRAAWLAAHAVAVTRLARARVVGMWLALVYLLVMVAVSPSYRSSLTVALACLVLLVWWHALARTKTLSWRGLSLLFTASIWWAPVVAWLTTLLANHVAAGPTGTHLGVSLVGTQTAVAGFAGESLKLVPLLVWAVAAPGRVRRLSCSDWLLAGFASGLGFQVVEDVLRDWSGRSTGAASSACCWVMVPGPDYRSTGGGRGAAARATAAPPTPPSSAVITCRPPWSQPRPVWPWRGGAAPRARRSTGRWCPERGRERCQAGWAHCCSSSSPGGSSSSTTSARTRFCSCPSGPTLVRALRRPHRRCCAGRGSSPGAAAAGSVCSSCCWWPLS